MENGKTIRKINIIDKILGKQEKGISCWVAAEKFDICETLPAIYYPKQKGVVSIRYKWKDGTAQEFLGKEGCQVTIFKGKPVFYHGVGDLFANRQSQGDLAMTSELYAEANDVNVVGQAVQALKEIQDGSGVPWKWILIIGAAAIGILILWQTGVIPNLLESFNISVGNSQGIAPQAPIQIE